MEEFAQQLERIEQKIARLSDKLHHTQEEYRYLQKEHEELQRQSEQQRQHTDALTRQLAASRRTIETLTAKSQQYNDWNHQLKQHITIIDDCIEWVRRQ